MNNLMRNTVLTVSSRAQEFKDEGMYVFDKAQQLMMCRYCSARVNWKVRSVVTNHINGKTHKENKEKTDAAAENRKRQSSIGESFDSAKKSKINKETFIKSTLHAFVKANIPLHKLDHPELRKWLHSYMPGSGDLPNARWLREHYLPQIKSDYDKDIREMLQGRKIAVLTDETTNKKGEAALIILFLVLPNEDNPLPLLIVASVTVLSACTGDQTCKSILHTLVEFSVAHEDVYALVSDSAAYMTLCAKLLRELGLTNMVHVQCWAHKLDKVAKVFSDKLPRLNECVSNTKKLFKNTRKRKHRYLKYLADKYALTKAKEPKLFPLPVMTRWGSWRDSVEYLSEYLNDVVDYAKNIPRSESAKSIQYFKNLEAEDIEIIKAEAVFTVEYCTPVDSLLKKVGSSKVAFSHKLYSSIQEVKKVFEHLTSASDIKDQLYSKSKSSLLVLPNNKQKSLETRMNNVSVKCLDILNKYMTEDTANLFFKSCQKLFDPQKVVMASVSEKSLLAAKNNLPMLTTVPDDQFKVLYSLFTDNVKEIVKGKVKPDSDPTMDALIAMKMNHSEFVHKCIQALYIPVANVDSERAFSAYGDILSSRRTRLKTSNTEIMMCLYFGDDINNNETDTGTPTIDNDYDSNPDDPDPVFL